MRRLLGFLAVTTAMILPSAGHAASVQGSFAPPICQPGDIVHTLAPGLFTIEPKPGFSPLTASDALLACYGFQTRPHDIPALRTWKSMMSRYHFQLLQVAHPSPAPPVSVPPQHQSHTSAAPPAQGLVGVNNTSNWAGYQIDSADNGSDYFTEAEAQFVVPSVVSNVSFNQYVYAWTGNGGAVSGSPLIWQAGTASITGATATYDWFFENYCPSGTSGCYNSGNPVILNCPTSSVPCVTSGQTVLVKVYSSTGKILLQNQSTGAASPLLVYPINNNNTGLTSEWIVEEACQSCPDVSFPNDVAWTGCYTYGTTLSTYLDVSFNYRRDDLYDYSKSPALLVSQPPPLDQSYDPPHGFSQTGSDPPY